MPQIKQIIFLKDKSGAFNLRDDIKSFGYDERREQFYVQFKKGDNYLYYNPANVDVANFVRQLEPPFRITRKKDGEAFFYVLGVRVFEGREHNAYRIIYENGTGKNYEEDYINIEEHIDDHRSINVWEYLNEVAKYNVIPIDDDKSVSLADKYAKMEFVAKNSLLEAYLNVDTINGHTYAANGIWLAKVIAANGGQTLCQAVTNNHVNADRVNKLLDLRTNGSTCCWEEMGIL